MKKDMLSKTLVIGVVVLFIAVGAQSALAVDIPKKEEIEPKDYLFDTIIAIANNPEIQDLIEENKNNIDNIDFNNRYIFRQLFFKNPELLLSMVFNKPKMTTQYLENSYNQGLELIEIFGEEKALEIMDSVKITNTELLDDINDIIMDDEDLSLRISTLIEMNNETNPICQVLFILGIRAIVKTIVLHMGEFIFRNYPSVELFFMVRSWLVRPQVFIINDLLKIFDCW
jgi:hypothetical protein